MPADTPHAQHSKYAARWQRMRDVIEGEDAIKEAGPLYLPKLALQESESYERYKARADFLAATGRSLLVFLGMV